MCVCVCVCVYVYVYIYIYNIHLLIFNLSLDKKTWSPWPSNTTIIM